jgi:signal transduction histidine kinase
LAKNYDESLMNLVKGLSLKSTSNLYPSLNKITEDICNFMGVARSSIWLYGENDESIICESLYKRDDKKHEEKGYTLYKKDFRPYFEALESERIILAGNAHTHHATQCFSEVYLTPLGIESMYDTPIWKADQVIGVLCLEYLRPKASWSIEEKNYLTSIADFIAKIFEKNSVLELIDSLEDKVQKRTNELEETVLTLKKAQEFLIQKEKLASLGTVVAGIAHELRNPLNHILVSSDIVSDLLSEETLDKETITEVNQLIKESAQRAETIIKDMLSQSLDNEIISNENLEEVIKYSYKLAVYKFADKSVLTSDIQFNIDSRFTCDMAKQKIQRVFINVFENALFSIIKRIEKENTVTPRISIECKRESEKYIITITDNGNGIEENIANRIFEPFFTTKGVIDGTGLGMSICYDIIRSHGGDIKIQSNGKVGALVTIELPKSRKSNES